MADASRVIELIFAAVDNASEVVGGIGEGLTAFGEGIDKANTKAQELAEPLAHLSELILGVVEAAQAAGVALLTFAVKSAGDFEQSFALISTKIQGSGADLGQFKQQILDFASNSSVSFDQVTAAVQTVVQVTGDYKTALEVVNVAQQLAVATGSDLTTTTQTLVIALRDFGAGADQAGHFSDVLFAAAKDGRLTFDDLSGTIGRIAPLASAAGLTFDETAAALATLGKAGIDSGAAASALTRILSSVEAPTATVTKAANQLGLEFDASAIKTKGFAGFLADVAAKTGGSATELEALGIKARGLNAALALTADGGANFAKVLDDIKNSTGATSTAYDVMVEQIGFATTRLENAIKGAAIAFGDPLVQAFVSVEDAATKIFLAIEQGVQAGDFKQLQDFFLSTLDAIEQGLNNVAQNLPEALKGLDFTPLIDQLEIAKEHFATLFAGLDLNTPEGLHAALQKLIDLGADLVAFHNGVVTAFTNIFGPIFKVGELVAGQGTNWATLAGEIGGTAIAITLFAPVLSAITSVILIVGTAITLTSGAVGLLTGAIEAAQAAFLATPIGLALFIAASATALLTSTNLGQSLLASAENFLGFGAAAEAATTGVTKHATGLGILAPQIDAVALSQLNLNDVTFKQVTSNADLHDSLGQLSTKWVEVDGVLQLVVTSSNDYLTSLGLVIDKTKELQDPTKQAADNIAAFFKEFGDGNAIFQTFGDNIDLAKRGFDTVIVETHDAEGNVTGFTEALQFVGPAATAATDKVITGLTKVQEEALKAQKQANDFNIEWEKIQSSERTAEFKIQADIDIAAIQAGTEQIKAAFESVDVTIKSTGDTLDNLVKSLVQVNANGTAGQEIISLLEDENRRRQEALDLQKQLVQAQVAYLNAVIDRLSQGDATIQVTADGLEPELEAFMFKILERIQVRASAEAQQFLLGL